MRDPLADEARPASGLNEMVTRAPGRIRCLAFPLVILSDTRGETPRTAAIVRSYEAGRSMGQFGYK